MKFSSTSRTLAAIIAASCLAIPASASAMPYSQPSTTHSDAAQSGSQPTTDRTDAAQAGSSGTTSISTFPSQGFSGDNPADHPGMSRAQQYDAPTTIEVVRPQRTIVRDVDQALPLILSSAALILVLAGAGTALVRTRMVPRPGRSH